MFKCLLLEGEKLDIIDLIELNVIYCLIDLFDDIVLFGCISLYWTIILYGAILSDDHLI